VKEIPSIVQRAIDSYVVDIGQLSRAEVAQLNRAAKRGLLQKTRAYWFPIPKTAWAAA
jgi:hypothetical protein